MRKNVLYGESVTLICDFLFIDSLNKDGIVKADVCIMEVTWIIVEESVGGLCYVNVERFIVDIM